jgi:integrase
LTWTQVNLIDGTVSFFSSTTKNDEGSRIVYLESEQLKLFNELFVVRQRLYPECRFVFHRKGQPIRDFRAAWSEACRKAGLSGKIPHDFRRTAVRDLIRGGGPEAVAM